LAPGDTINWSEEKMDGSEWRRLHPTRRQVLESAAALAILGYTRPSFSAEADLAAIALSPADPSVAAGAGGSRDAVRPLI